MDKLAENAVADWIDGLIDRCIYADNLAFDFMLESASEPASEHDRQRNHDSNDSNDNNGLWNDNGAARN